MKVVIAQTNGCGESQGCKDMLPERLGVVMRQWWGGGICVGDEFWPNWPPFL